MEHHHHHPDHHKPEPPAEKQRSVARALQHIGHDGHSGPVNHRAYQGSTGMKQKHGHAGHDHGAMIADFLRRFWICLVLSVPVVALSMMFQDVAGYQLDFPYREPLVVVLATIIYVYGGWPFLTGMVGELRTRQPGPSRPGMMTLVAVAITAAYVYSVAVSVGWLHGMDFFWELATLIDIMLLGHYLEMKSVAGASRSLELIVQMLPAEAHKVEGGTVKDVKVDVLSVGDVVLIRPGERIPTDGEVIEGGSAVNESMLTGESVPVEKKQRDSVIAGAVNGEGSLTVRVTHKGEDSYLNKVVRMVEEAQNAKSQTQTLADRAAGWLTLISLTVGVLTLIVWLAVGKEPSFAIERMVTVMVTACPHALGVAIPLVVAISTAISAQKGLLIRNRTAFEESRKITAMVFDKTGTLTEGEFGVTRMSVLQPGLDKTALLSTAAALEQQSQHPIAQGIVREANKRGLHLPEVSDFQSITGKGVSATVDGATVRIVSPRYLQEKGIQLPQDAYGSEAETVVFVLINEQLAGYVALADRIREDSREAARRLQQAGIKVYMATGDNQKVADAVAKKLGLDGVYAEVLPDQKVNIVKDLQRQGQFVAMTGDGVNDAPALAQANVGIAVGSSTDVAAETADIILVNSKPTDITNLVEFGRATYRKMIQNLFWATGYNVIAIPLAAGVLYPNFVLSPAIGAVLMSASTVIVALNAQLLKRSMK
ncbi:cadmium-translocating P-type ATPase [Rudanella paleaurantiibacter]|uniref:Cadmium-translocating P-type ATPase n=1 Tax=Rudanella paleaurantiibacter TaxID=2614655 RepID=A0A7J5TSK8_9BACT|nr:MULTISPECIES: heavy metal translocating P-type ATPase [Rudanella]KAB7726475.1 cadmium-translocating P-type ATPase [Rudanella paleaurantiibacter]